MEKVCISCNSSFDEFYIETDEKSLGCEVYRLYSNKNGKDYCWCFCLESLYKWIIQSERAGLPSNPITREPISKDIVEDIKEKYLLTHLEVPDEAEIDDFAKKIVEMKIAMHERTNQKIPVELISKHVLALYKDIAELEDQEWDDLRWDNIRTQAVEKLKNEGRF